MAKPNCAVFLDKDGTLIDDVPYNVDPSLVRLARGAAEGLPVLHRLGYRIIVVSNQSGVARGMFSEQALEPIEARLRELLAALGVPLAAFYYCPHYPEGSDPRYAIACDCRKPEPGLIERAAREHRIDLPASWLIGNSLDDVQAGHRAGCQTILIRPSLDPERNISADRTPHHVAADLTEAARLIGACGDLQPARKA